MISRHVIYCDHYPDGAGEAGSNARERKPATVSHEFLMHKWSPEMHSVGKNPFDQSFPYEVDWWWQGVGGGLRDF